MMDKKPHIIAGPCSAESPEQLLASCKPLADLGKVNMVRAGIWKPRTRPDSFEGMGKQALTWLKEVGVEIGLPVCTEVANPKHVEQALAANIDVLWVGARTTVNPFSVQAIADALKGVNIPVMVKNPINPDINLWVGAIERLRHAGLNQLSAVHRGFSFYGKSEYRNKPMWELAIALKTWFPELPLICDPSHICGRRDLIPAITQRSMDLGFDGLMIEVHENPDAALSDAKQQLTPDAFHDMLNSLVIRSGDLSDPIVADQLLILRSKIDEIDDEIIRLIGARMDVAEEIGEYKRDKDITVLQLQRWKEILETRGQLAAKLNLSADFVEKYLEHIHKESIRKQTDVMDQKGAENDEVLW